MSASLDDMPEYEHFQDELDLELKRYQHVSAIPHTDIEHDFIQYACFTLFLKNPTELSEVIFQHILSELPDSEQRVISFLHFVDTDVNSFLKGRFSELLNSYTE